MNRITVIDYPAPNSKIVEAKTPVSLASPKFIIYGQVREDKAIFEFLQTEAAMHLDITVAGPIEDKRIFEIAPRENLTIIDRYFIGDEILGLIPDYDFMLLPYPTNYTNGAGTFKDSLSMGFPVVCSKIEIFQEIVEKYDVGLTFDSPIEILSKVKKINNNRYKELSQNCLKYASQFDALNMRNGYFAIYDKLLSD